MVALPLRLSDRVERVGRRLCILVAVLGLPLAIMIAWASHNASAVSTDRYAASVHRTSATTLEDAPPLTPVTSTIQPKVAAKWIGTDQVVHRGAVEVPRGTESGTEVTIWINAASDATSPPQSSNQLVVDAILLAIAVAMCVAGVAYVTYLLLRLALERMRSREWDLAWEDFARRQHL